MPYLPPEDVEGFVRFLVAFPLIDQTFIDSWWSAFDPAYRHTLADLPAVLPRLEAAFTRFNGARDAGKTYTRKLVAHVAQKTLAFRFAWVEIEREQAANYTADWLIEELVRSAVPAADGIPARREPVRRWIGDLATWAIKQLASLGADRPVWMVIDGIRHPGLPLEVCAVVERLAAMVATPTGVLPLRLVLIDCDPVDILRTGCMAEEESVEHLTVKDAEKCLQKVLDPATFPARWPHVQAMLAATAAPTTSDVGAAMRSALS